MSINTLANVGMFCIAIIGYLVITGILGLLISGDTDDFTAPAWIFGALLYAITIIVLCKV